MCGKHRCRRHCCGRQNLQECMKQKITIRYPSWERFASDTPALRQGKIFLPTRNPLPVDTPVSIHFFLPGITEEFVADGLVVGHGGRTEGQPGMIVAFIRGSEKILARLLTAHEATPVDNPAEQQEKISLDWLRDALRHDDEVTLLAVDEAEPEPAPAPLPEQVRRNLSSSEVSLVRPVADFLISMTKAMLRSGYYDPSHPANRESKQGLFSEFHNALGQAPEMMFTLSEGGGEQDITIIGVLDEPVSVRRLIGAGQAELFMPKIHDYFERKNLVSLTLKKSITRDHFHSFVDIMHSQEGEGEEESGRDEILSRRLAAAGITEVSAVFRSDMLQLGKNLPWRVQVAIHRLFKDIKMLPLYQDKTDAEIKEMKVRIVEDILRPLKHPKLLADLVVNCYIIASNIDALDSEDMERTIVSSFPLNMLAEASRHILEEMKELGRGSAGGRGERDAARVKKGQMASIKRVLRILGQRMIEQGAAGSAFFEELHQHKIMRLDELPQQVRYRINSRLMASDLTAKGTRYCEYLRRSRDPEEVSLLLRGFRRAAPLLVEHRFWAVLLDISRAAAALPEEIAMEATGMASAACFILQDVMESLGAGLAEPPAVRRPVLQLFELTGEPGVATLLSALLHCEEREARREVLQVLISIGEAARSGVLAILEDPEQSWVMIRNALLVLGHVGNREQDLGRVRKFLHHVHPRVREESLVAAIKLKARDIEPILMNAINDKDEKVRQRVISSLNLISPLSQSSIARLLDMIQSAPPDDQEEAESHDRLAAMTIKALGIMASPRDPKQIEESILAVAQQITGRRKGFFDFFSITREQERSVILAAALEALGKIGGPLSLEYLQEIAEGDDVFAEQARQWLNMRRKKKGGSASLKPAGN